MNIQNIFDKVDKILQAEEGVDLDYYLRFDKYSRPQLLADIFAVAAESVQESFRDIGEFNIKVSNEDAQEIQLHVLANLSAAFGITEEDSANADDTSE